jgi:transcriptional regulator with XRE-family HTH domain
MPLVMLNMALKVAIIQSAKEQGDVAALAKIHHTRLSQIVRGRVTPSESEKLRIAGVLQRPVEELFPEVAA